MFRCEICNYNANTKAVLTRHLNTKKHITLAESKVTESSAPETKEKIECSNCNKEFKLKSGLERHMLKCIKSEEIVKSDQTKKENENEMDSDSDDDKKEYQHNITRLIVEIIRNRYEFEIETELIKKSYEEKINQMKSDFERLYIAKEMEIKNLQAQIQKLSKKK